MSHSRGTIAWPRGIMSHGVLLLVLILCLPGPHELVRRAAALGGLPILSYDVKEAKTDAWSFGELSWARYEQDVCGADMLSSVNSPLLEELLWMDIRTDFFYKRNVSLAVSSLGFVAATSVPMCYSMCADRDYRTLYGFYQFTDNPNLLETLGGDWPVIAPFLALITPSSTTPALCLSNVHSETTASGDVVQWQTVEYKDYTDSVTRTATLNAQVTIYTNGTIIFRYKETPTFPVESGTGLPPSVGLVLSKQQRVLASVPAGVTSDVLFSLRFEPIRDTCAALTERAACVGQGNCGWCTATRQCTNRFVSEEQCPKGYYSTEATATPPAAGTAPTFYSVDISQDSCYHVASPVPYRGSTSGRVESSWAFPFFGQAGPTDNLLSLNSVLSLGGFTASAGTPSPECNPMWNMCVNGNYTSIIAPLLGAMVPQPLFTSQISRAWRIALSEDGFARVRGRPLRPYATSGGVPFAAESLSYELYVDVNGTVEFLYGCDPVLVETALSASGSSSSNNDDSGVDASGSEGEPYAAEGPVDYFAYPPPIVGLIRNTVDDAASVVIPPLLIRSGTRIRFTLRTSCPDCGLHGRCDETTATCTCDRGFTGVQCHQCETGFFGRDCLQCERCENGGTCDDGISGTGACLCNDNYAGQRCETLCASRHACATLPCARSGHGYCDCDGCVCTDGYTGENCQEAPTDPCFAYSLDGCEVCNGRSPGCNFCFDSYCFSPERAVAGTGHACSRPIPSNFSQVCVTLRQPILIGIDTGYAILGALTGFLVLFYLLVGVLLYYGISAIRSYHFDRHVALATGGIVDFKSVRREREVAEAFFFYEERAARSDRLLAFPLKQISLKKLYRRQRGQEDGSNEREL